jgi:hypothetical protein
MSMVCIVLVLKPHYYAFGFCEAFSFSFCSLEGGLVDS